MRQTRQTPALAAFPRFPRLPSPGGACVGAVIGGVCHVRRGVARRPPWPFASLTRGASILRKGTRPVMRKWFALHNAVPRHPHAARRASPRPLARRAAGRPAVGRLRPRGRNMPGGQREAVAPARRRPRRCPPRRRGMLRKARRRACRGFVRAGIVRACNALWRPIPSARPAPRSAAKPHRRYDQY